MVIAVSHEIILMVMDCVILKTLENRLKKKGGQTVQSLDIISQEFTVVLANGLKRLTNFDVVKWPQVTKIICREHKDSLLSSKAFYSTISLRDPL